MDASIRAATILNLWAKIEHLINQELIIESFQQKNRRAASSEKVFDAAGSATDVTIMSSSSTSN
jgi:hypothetical protein